MAWWALARMLSGIETNAKIEYHRTLKNQTIVDVRPFKCRR